MSGFGKFPPLARSAVLPVAVIALAAIGLWHSNILATDQRRLTQIIYWSVEIRAIRGENTNLLHGFPPNPRHDIRSSAAPAPDECETRRTRPVPRRRRERLWRAARSTRGIVANIVSQRAWVGLKCGVKEVGLDYRPTTSNGPSEPARDGSFRFRNGRWLGIHWIRI